MYHYWRHNKNVILTAVALFMVSLTSLLYFLTADPQGGHGDLKADVVDSLTVKALQETEKSYRNLLEDHEGPIAVVGLDGLMEFSSWDFESVTGFRQDSIKGELFYSFIHPEDLPMFIGAFGKALASEEPITMVGPYRMRDAKGEYQLHMASLYPVKEEEKIAYIVIAIRDITADVEEAKEVEEHTEDDSVDKNNGHGNEQDKCDEDNPGKGEHCNTSPQKKIRNTKNEEKSRLIGEKLAQLLFNHFRDPSHGRWLSLLPSVPEK